MNLGVSGEGDLVFLADRSGEREIHVSGKVGCPFFGEMILDCLNGTQRAMTQEHIFKAAELSVKAQMLAQKLE